MSASHKRVSLPQLSILSFDPTVNAADKKKGAPDEAERPKDNDMQTHTTAGRTPHSIATTVTVGEDPEVLNQEYQRAQTWLAQKLDQARRNIFTEVVVITPVIADLILKRNPDNRGIRAGRLSEIRSDLENGNFVFNGETIIISKEGYLNDGQHRMIAVRDSGVPLKTVVVFGVPRTSRLTVDQGTARTSADYLGMSGTTKDAMVISAVARLIWQYRKFGTIDTRGRNNRRTRNATKSEIVGIAGDCGPEIDRSLKCTARCGKWMGSRSLVAFTHWVFARVDHNAATDFFDRLVDGAVAVDEPIHTLRQRMITDPTMSAVVRFEASVRTWNAHRRGLPLGKIMIMGRIPELKA